MSTFGKVAMAGMPSLAARSASLTARSMRHAEDARHGRDLLAAVLAVDDEDRPDQIVDRQPVFLHQPARPVGLAHAAQSPRAGDLVDGAGGCLPGEGEFVHRNAPEWRASSTGWPRMWQITVRHAPLTRLDPPAFSTSVPAGTGERDSGRMDFGGGDQIRFERAGKAGIVTLTRPEGAECADPPDGQGAWRAR